MEKEKKIPKKMRVTDEPPAPTLPSPPPHLLPPRSLHMARKQENPFFWDSSEPRRGCERVEAGGCGGLHTDVSVRLSVCVLGRHTLASSISRKSLCMGTLPCSFTL